MKYQILNRRKILKNNFFDIQELALKIDTYQGEDMEIQRYVMYRPEVAAVILEINETKEIVLVEQFRFSATKTTSGWIKEVVAGIVEKGEDPENTAIRETMEETGYAVEKISKIFEYYPSPGISDQFVHLYYAQTSKKNEMTQGGLLDEGEDIRLFHYKTEELGDLINSKKIIDGKTIIALQWYLSQKK